MIGPNTMGTYMKLLNVSVGEGTKRSTVIFELEAGDKTRNASDYSTLTKFQPWHFGFGQMGVFP